MACPFAVVGTRMTAVNDLGTLYPMHLIKRTDLDRKIVVPDGPASVFIRVGGPASPSSTAPTGGLAPQRGVYTLGAIARSACSLQWRGP